MELCTGVGPQFRLLARSDEVSFPGGEAFHARALNFGARLSKYRRGRVPQYNAIRGLLSADKGGPRKHLGRVNVTPSTAGGLPSDDLPHVRFLPTEMLADIEIAE